MEPVALLVLLDPSPIWFSSHNALSAMWVHTLPLPQPQSACNAVREPFRTAMEERTVWLVPWEPLEMRLVLIVAPIVQLVSLSTALVLLFALSAPVVNSRVQLEPPLAFLVPLEPSSVLLDKRLACLVWLVLS